MNPVAAGLAGLSLSLALTLTPSESLAVEPTAGDAATVIAESGKSLVVLRDDATYLELAFAGWGPEWSFLNLKDTLASDDRETRMTAAADVNTGATVTIEATVRPADASAIKLDTTVRATTATDLTSLILSLDPGAAFEKGQVVATFVDGSTNTRAFPLERGDFGGDVKQLDLRDAAGETTSLTIDPPTPVAFDGNLRVVLANKLTEGDAIQRTFTLTTPGGSATFYGSPEAVPAGSEGWYAFEPDDDHDAPSVIGMQSWLDAPAGKHGRITSDGEHLVYDGEPIKLWGLNLCYSACAPSKDLAEKQAAMYAKYGINAVRLHKYADGPGWQGIQGGDSFLTFDAEALDRMDYFVAQLKERGIFVKLSSTFGVKLGEGDRDRVPYLDEFGELGDGATDRVNTRHGSIYLSDELQDLQIEQVVNLLNHRNPYTGLTYAEDPTIAVVELFNEDSALFAGTMAQLQRVPTLRERASRDFTTWLLEKYGEEAAVMARWGNRALNSFGNEGLVGESWAQGNIVPAGNPWFYDPAQLDGSQRLKKERLLDTIEFLYDQQNAFYDRYKQALRDAGYEGEVLSSNWQAGRAFSHYANLHSDARIGLIDRHNYFGGGSGGEIDDAAMLDQPGGGMLSSGLQQVADRPFMLSEWIHVFPSEWGAEGVAIIGAYGMGLQGWDASFMFQNRDRGQLSEEIGRERWDVAAPQVMGLFPAVSRQVLRGDVAEATETSVRNVHVPSLFKGELGFNVASSQNADI